MSAARIVSPDVFSESVGLSDNEEDIFPNPSADDTFEEPEEHDDNDETAPWVEVSIRHELTEDEANDSSFISYIDSECRSGIAIGDELADSRMSDGSSVSNIFDYIDGRISRDLDDVHTPDSLPNYVYDPEAIDLDEQYFLERYADTPILRAEASSSSAYCDDDFMSSANYSSAGEISDDDERIEARNRKRSRESSESETSEESVKRFKAEESDDSEYVDVDSEELAVEVF